MTMNFDVEKLLAAVGSFSGIRVLVIGDVMLDEFIWGKVSRISPEAPVPVVEVTRDSRLLGGAANVVNNIVSAGGKAMLAGVVGPDEKGREIRRMLDHLSVDSHGIIEDDSRPTTIKTRVVAHGQQVVRFDREKRGPVNQSAVGRILDYLEQVADQVDAVIVSDYGKGMITRVLMDEVRRIFLGRGRIVAVDPKVNNFKLYKEVTVITPNHLEAAQGAGLIVESEDELFRAGRVILDNLNCASVLITRGEQGMTLMLKGALPTNIPTVAKEVFDVTGAGDTVIAVYTLSLAAGLSPVESAVVANYAAGVVVGEVGTSTVTAEELKGSIANGAYRRKSRSIDKSRSHHERT